MSPIRIALVQPRTIAPPADEANVPAACAWIARAAAAEPIFLPSGVTKQRPELYRRG